MMHNLEQAGVAVVEQSLPNCHSECQAILDVVAGHHRNALYYTDIQPADRPGALRKSLSDAAPRLVEFADSLMSRLERSGCGVFVPALGLAELDRNTRSLLVYALCACIAPPTPTDRARRQIIWDVKHRSTQGGYFPTFSEHNGEAEYHTDSQYFPMPEKYFALYVLNAASCGGGISQICDGRGLRDDLVQRGARWALDILTERMLPFRVPSAFTTSGIAGAVQATLAPVFCDAPVIRYRRDTLQEGLKHFPSLYDADVQAALGELERTIENSRASTQFLMPSDSLLLMDNHVALHARTAFDDLTRHLLRIRMQPAHYLEKANRFPLVSPMSSALRSPDFICAKKPA